ncbi:expressed conserved protein [Echinococcus multilocularis]|uniref:Expressed conserved protein n=1 Tax=Echinococcus multilocularis TaxID=6211 RepID=A0A068XZU4_ECHMU|nr:expressed conserved protein [Echinococcus multilocularis]
MWALAFILSLLTATQPTFAFVTGDGQGGKEFGLKIDGAITVPKNTGYTFATDAISPTSTPLIMQTNTGYSESSNFPEYGTEQSAIEFEVGEHEGSGETEQSLEAVINGSAHVTKAYESTDSSGIEADRNAATIKGGLEMSTEEFNKNATTVFHDKDSTGESASPESKVEGEEGTMQDVEEGHVNESEEKKEEVLTGKPNAGDDEALTAVTADTEPTIKNINQKNKANENETSPNPDTKNANEVPVDITGTMEIEKLSDHSINPSGAPSTQAAKIDQGEEETLTIEKKGIAESSAGVFSDAENRLEDTEIHEWDSEVTAKAPSLATEQSTSTDSSVDENTAEESIYAKKVEEEEILEEKVENGMEEVIKETTTETSEAAVGPDGSSSPPLGGSTTEGTDADISNSRVATVKTYAATANKTVQLNAPWFKSLRMDIVRSLYEVKDSISQAATSLQKAVEVIQEVMVSFVDGVQAYTLKDTSYDLADDVPIKSYRS